MTATIHPIVSQSAVDAAWNEYAVLAQQLADNHQLLSDRDYNERLARTHEKWRRLFLTDERQKNVIPMGGKR